MTPHRIGRTSRIELNSPRCQVVGEEVCGTCRNRHRRQGRVLLRTGWEAARIADHDVANGVKTVARVEHAELRGGVHPNGAAEVDGGAGV